MSGCRLLCIPHDQTEQFWPHVAPLIKAAMEKGRLSDYAGVEDSVRGGSALLWIAWNGEKIKAAAVTELGQANGEKFCTIVACGGSERGQWLHLLAGLEAYGKAEGCAAMRIYGRRGWLRLLPEYRTTRVLLEKKLPDYVVDTTSPEISATRDRPTWKFSVEFSPETIRRGGCILSRMQGCDDPDGQRQYMRTCSET